MAKASDIRKLLKDLGLSTKQRNEALDYLKGGGDFKGFKNLLKGYGFSGIGDLRNPVQTYLETLGGGTAPAPQPTPTPTPTPTVTPTPPPAPTPTPTPTPPPNVEDLFPAPQDDLSDLFPGTGDYEETPTVGPELPTVGPVQPTPTPTPLPDDLSVLFPGTGDYEETPIVGPIQPTTTPTPPTPPQPTASDYFQEFMDSFQFPDFETLMGEQAAMYEQMLADAEAERERLAAEAELRRRTEMSNMAQGSRVADFRAGITDRGRGGTSEFKRRAAPSSMLSINPMVNRSLSLGAGIMGRPRRTYR